MVRRLTPLWPGLIAAGGLLLGMSAEQSAGELMVFGLIGQADRLGKSARTTQQALDELAEMEESIKLTIASIHAAVKSLEGERVKMETERAKLKAVGSKLQKASPQETKIYVR